MATLATVHAPFGDWPDEVTTPCPYCGWGEFTVTNNRGAPGPRPPITIHDDEGQPISECLGCEAELVALKQRVPRVGVAYLRDEGGYYWERGLPYCPEAGW
jgi:hypothetical protein